MHFRIFSAINCNCDYELNMRSVSVAKWENGYLLTQHSSQYMSRPIVRKFSFTKYAAVKWQLSLSYFNSTSFSVEHLTSETLLKPGHGSIAIIISVKNMSLSQKTSYGRIIVTSGVGCQQKIGILKYFGMYTCCQATTAKQTTRQLPLLVNGL
jgi:hypothetical protein